MAKTNVRGTQIKDATVQRVDLDVSTPGQAVIAKVIQGTGAQIASTGGDAGTGDVTISLGLPVAEEDSSPSITIDTLKVPNDWLIDNGDGSYSLVLGGGSIPPGSVQTYTPAWTSTGTAPSLGNGSLTGRYIIIGKLMLLQVLLQTGTTTTTGSGNYRFSLPPGITISNRYHLDAFAWNGSYWRGQALTNFIDGTHIGIIKADGTGTEWGQGVPFMFSNGVVYQIIFSGICEID